jgi:tetratricopeptide (TPR) repeat protein
MMMRCRRIFLLSAILIGIADLEAQTNQADAERSLLTQCLRADEQAANAVCGRALDRRVLESGIQIPADSKLYLRLGRLLAQRGQLDNAIKLYRLGTDAIPENGELPYLLAKTLLDVGACLEAYGPALEALKRGPKTVPLQILLGRIELCRGASAQAQEYFTSARDQGAGVEAYAGLGLALAAGGHHEAALTQFEMARKLRPDERAYQLYIGRSLQALGRYQEAITVFNGVLSDATFRAEGYCGLALAFRGLGDVAKAKAACQSASEPGQHRSSSCDCTR